MPVREVIQLLLMDGIRIFPEMYPVNHRDIFAYSINSIKIEGVTIGFYSMEKMAFYLPEPGSMLCVPVPHGMHRIHWPKQHCQ